MYTNITRRQALKSTLALSALPVMGSFRTLEGFLEPDTFKVGACDWSIGELGTVDAIEVGSQIGLDGIQVSLGTVADNMHLREPRVQQAYKAACERHDMAIGGIAIGELNNVPFKSDDRAIQWVSDSIDVAKAMGVKVVLLAFFAEGDLKNDVKGTAETIRRLKAIMPKAEKNGILLGIESWLSAKEHMYIIDAVGSPNLKVYYDVANSHKMGYDIYEEIRWLGKNRICEFHAKENNFLLGKGRVDFKRVKRAMDDIGYCGWVHIEGAIPENGDLMDSYQWNNAFLRSVLNT